MADEPKSVAVVGAGLVGTLCAAMLSQRGWKVTLFEARSDPRIVSDSVVRARSINLALSPRGIQALKSVSKTLAANVLMHVVPMRGRLIHYLPEADGTVKTSGQDYGNYEEGEWINSVSRGGLGKILVEYLASDGNEVEILFDHKLIDMDLRAEKGVVLNFNAKTGDKIASVSREFDFVIGADGAYSQVRRQMMRGGLTRLNFSQSYARHCYLELSVSGGPDNNFMFAGNYLHIWPRREFMLIALPNSDKSFTLTLFAPKDQFDLLKQENGKEKLPVVDLFEKEFPDALEAMGVDNLIKFWKENPIDGLVTIECSPYHFQNKVLLLGDAAHGMVPFYGQGMNCGFEDVRVLSTILDIYDASPQSSASRKIEDLPYSQTCAGLPAYRLDPNVDRLQFSLDVYTKIRKPSINAIQTLALSNYNEMAASVLDPFYVLRLGLDKALGKISSWSLHSISKSKGKNASNEEDGVESSPVIAIAPSSYTWQSLYSMVTFRFDLSYEEALRRRKIQTRVLEWISGSIVVGLAGIGIYGARLLQKQLK